MLCNHPKNMFCCKCTCLYWIRRSKLQVPFCFLCLLTGLRYACSFCCYDSAGSIDPPDALNVGCFQAGKLTSLLPKLPHHPKILLVKYVYQEKHRFCWYHQLYRGSLNDRSVWQRLWLLTTVALPAKVFKFPSVSAWFWKLHLSATLSNTGFQLF